MRDYKDVIDRLKTIDGIKAVRDGSTGRIKAIDFKIFEMSRPTTSSNFVFGHYGMRYKNGLIRLPRVSKSEFESDRLEHRIQKSITSKHKSRVEIRLKPEVDLDDDYYYPHIEICGDIRDSVHIVESIVDSYNPP